MRPGLDEVKEIPITRVAEKIGMVPVKGTSYRCPFPDHRDSNPSFTLFPKTNSCWCFGCGRGGDNITLVALSQSCSVSDAIKWLRGLFSIQTVPGGDSRRFTTKLAKQVSETQPEEFSTNYAIYSELLASSPLTADAKSYLGSRKITTKTISHFRLGSIDESADVRDHLIRKFGLDDVYRCGLLPRRASEAPLVFPSKSIVFPFIENENVVYLQTRLLPDRDGPRWMGPRGITKPVYNIGRIQNAKSVYICEGATDVLAAFELKFTAIGLLGATSNIPNSTLIALNGRTIYIVPDNDDVGEQMAERVQTKLKKAGLAAVIKRLPCGKDLNDFLIRAKAQK